MDDTKLTPRRAKILDIVSCVPIAGIEIAEKTKDLYPMSKATLMRELVFLKDKKLIKVQGKGKNTVYVSLRDSFDKHVDLEEYFKEDSQARIKGVKNFKLDVVSKFKNAFSGEEKKNLDSVSKKLSEQKRKIDPSIFKREIERFTVEFAWKSSKIEGNTYSLLETEILIKQMKEAVGHSKYEAIMILNHKNAIDYILQKQEEFKILTVEKVVNLHNILTKDLEISTGIRKNRVAITGTEYVPLDKPGDIAMALQKSLKQ